MTHRRPLAISLVETLVVVAVLGLLIALLLPAVGRAREASRFTQCRGFLKQLGLALHNYHDKHQCFPSGITASDFGPQFNDHSQFVAAAQVCERPELPRVTGLTLILPYMEEHAVYQVYNMQVACCARENATAVSNVVKGFVCPSNPRHLNRFRVPYYLGTGEVGPTDYVFSMGGVGILTRDNPNAVHTGVMPTGIRPPGIMCRAVGAFGVHWCSSIERMKDGTSATFLMGESAGGPQVAVGLAGSNVVEGAQRMDAASTTEFCDNPWSMSYVAGKGGGANHGFGSVFAATAWNAWYDPQGNMTDPAGGANWIGYPINEGRLKFHRPTWQQSSRPASDRTGTNGAALPSSTGCAQGFRSFHNGTANFLLGDGSLRSFNENTDAKILVGFSSLLGRETEGSWFD
jgi:prepilin-type processing-associated H-X9-DG protein